MPLVHQFRHLMLAFAVFKGTVVAIVVLLMGTTFFQSLLVAIVSGGLGIAGMLGSAYISVRAAQQNRELLNDIKGTVGANKREGDE